jgi:hypothetical protein
MTQAILLASTSKGIMAPKKKPTAAEASLVVHKVNKALKSLLRPVGELHEDPKNARRHDKADLAVLARSYADHGQQKPIVVDADGKVIAGNGTLAAVISLGWTHVAALVYDGTSAQAAAAFALVDNRSAELSSWNFDNLKIALLELPPDLLGTVGFNEKELAALMAVPSEVDVAGHTREITEFPSSSITCPKCGFEFDEHEPK